MWWHFQHRHKHLLMLSFLVTDSIEVLTPTTPNPGRRCAIQLKVFHSLVSKEECLLSGQISLCATRNGLARPWSTRRNNFRDTQVSNAQNVLMVSLYDVIYPCYSLTDKRVPCRSAHRVKFFCREPQYGTYSIFWVFRQCLRSPKTY